MKRLLIPLLLLIPGLLFSQQIFDTPLSPRIANYQIKINLDASQKIIRGTETLKWKNTSNLELNELQFHLYMNAFRNPQSTFLREKTRRHRSLGEIVSGKLGGVDILEITMDEKYVLTDSIKFIRPDDNNQFDSTVISLSLPKAVKPGREIILRIDFETRLPQIIARTGYVHNFFLLGQWFPKIGVFTNGAWNCHQFHPNSEFYADFGVYDVEITLPAEYQVGATGILLKEVKSDSLKTLSFHAEDVHDFALTAWPDFREIFRMVEGVRVRLLYAKEHRGHVERYFESIKDALHYMGKWLMPYPYPNLTIVDPPLYALMAGGMEYPCFITSASIWGTPEDVRFLCEEATIHEFIHQYFYGILASNEFEEPWLDEGFTTYATQKVLSERYGLHSAASALLNIRIGGFDTSKKDYMEKPDADYIARPSWEFDQGTYGRYVYNKAALMLQTLENYLGKEVMKKILLAYLERWKFRHPRGGDFTDIVNEIAPENMDWFFRQALYGTDILDYSLSQISNRKPGKGSAISLDSDSAQYSSQVKVTRNGTFVFPVKVMVVFSNSDTLIEKWDGRDRYHIFRYDKAAKVTSASVDPQNEIWLDLNWTNNTKTFNENKIAFWRHWLKSIKLYQSWLLLLFGI